MDPATSNQTTISAEVEIKGTIRSSGTVRLDGRLEGDLECQGDAVLGKTAVVTGNVLGNSVTILGTLHGNITAKDKIEMKATAKVHGDIKSRRLSVEDGVTFIGRSEVNPASQQASAPAATPANPPPKGENPDDRRGGMFGRR